MKPLEQSAIIEISGDDLATILTDAFCGQYTPFQSLIVAEVTLTNQGEFQLQLVSREEATAA